jgi:hypothetical protein
MSFALCTEFGGGACTGVQGLEPGDENVTADGCPQGLLPQPHGFKGF